MVLLCLCTICLQTKVLLFVYAFSYYFYISIRYIVLFLYALNSVQLQLYSILAMSISIQHVSRRFSDYQALSHISLEIESGEFVALLGPSGCGKTTLLRIIAGLESADTGQIILEGNNATHTPVRERGIGFVFQNYALFPSMSVADNISFGLRMLPKKERPNKASIQQQVQRLIELVQLDGLADRYPAQLSGGQRQRVALARALAVRPRVLLLDEPFGALDAKVRKELRQWLKQLHNELKITSVFVTHDQEEAAEVADRIVVMNKGHVEQMDTPAQLYAQPATHFVREFLAV